MYVPNTRKFWSVGIGHFVADTFGSSGVVLLTFLSTALVPMSNTQLGLAISARQLAGAISQPFFGLRADRTGGRGLGVWGLTLIIACFTLTLTTAIFTHNYYLLLIPFILEGIGSGAIHPVGALHAAEADDHHVASNTAFFFLLGQTGLALGPALAGFLIDWANKGSLLTFSSLPGFPGGSVSDANITPMYLMPLAALPVIFFLAGGIPRSRPPKIKPTSNGGNDEKDKSSAKMELATLLPFFVIGAMVLLRSLGQPGSVNFIPALFDEKGWSPAQYGLITSFFWIASGVSGVVLGGLADRFDRRVIVMTSMVLSAPAFFFLPIVDGPIAFGLAVLAGGFSGGAHSIIVVLAQELVPGSKAFASGAILGFIFGTGALGSLLIGVVADSIGLGITFQLVAGIMVISGVMGLLLPKSKHRPGLA